MASGSATASNFAGITAPIQEDAGIPGDAPDSCADLDPLRILQVNGGAHLDAMLVPEDDLIDYFVLDIGPDMVLDRIEVMVVPTEINVQILDIDVLFPNCGESALVAPEVPPPVSNAPAPGPGQKAVGVENTSYFCAPGQWAFQMNQLSDPANAPPTIHVMWSNGAQENIPLAEFTPAAVARYTTTSNLDSQIWSVSANVPDWWKGHFKIKYGPCNGEATPPPTWQPPEKEPMRGEFSVQEGLPHVAVVISKGLKDPNPLLGLPTRTSTTSPSFGFVGASAGLSGSAPSIVAKPCHDTCLAGFGYDLIGQKSE